MKKRTKFSLLLLLGASLLLFACSGKNNRHIGEWWSTDKYGNTIKLILDKNNNATELLDSQIIDMEWIHKVKDRRVEFKYEIDYTKDPIWFDLILYDKKTENEKKRIKAIIRFINDDKIECRSSMNSNRYERFDSTDDLNVRFLERKKQ